MDKMARDAAVIAELAKLPLLEYDRLRATKAEEMKIRPGTLDEEVRRARRASIQSDNHRAPEYSDDALALSFTARHGGTHRYVAAWGKWLEWTGQKWSEDSTLRVYDLARAICREAAAECRDDDTAAGIAKATTIAAVERLARNDRRHAATIDQWDADPWLLNTPSGVVDLREGKMFPHRPEYHSTKITTVAPAGDCPIWQAFLAKVTNGNQDLQTYLQRIAGYCLTGTTREHAMFFVYGLGGNGKGVFINTLTSILGDYAAVASVDTFTASMNDRHPADLAMLRGARLVTAQETEEGRRWAESKIKSMTGGDPITARFMRQDFFTYQPQFKLVIAGNHKPQLRNVDDAIRRRFNLIPFDVKIAANERDPELPEKLKAEWPGILKWAIEGCTRWQDEGLRRPAAVTIATEDYFDTEDAFGLWMKECCVETRAAITSSATLFKSWSAWALDAGERAGSQKAFSQKLADKGFKRVQITSGMDKGKAAFEGILTVLQANPPPYAEYE